MLRIRSLSLLLAVLFVSSLPLCAQGRDADDRAKPLVVAQISDLHIGLTKNGKTGESIDPLANLRRVINEVNERQPDLVIVSGDIGENPQAWQQARDALKAVHAPVKFIPGNHDVNSTNVAPYRGVFGDDYYTFRMRNVVFYMIDSELLGNYDHFNAHEVEPLPPQTVAESDKMLHWLDEQSEHASGGSVAVAVQHVPTSRGGDKAPDQQKPYWITQDPYRSHEIELLHKLGVKHIFAGHWHKAVDFQADGFTVHVAPATSWATQGPLGFLIHTISPNGDVKTELVEVR